MNYPSAIVIVAGLIAGALILSSQGVSQTSAGRYAIAPVSGANGNGGVWRMDTNSGAVSYCGPPAEGFVCSKWAAPPK